MDALPLPPRPNLPQYRKRAKDLVAAMESIDPGALRTWAGRWAADLVRLEAPMPPEGVERLLGSLEGRIRDRVARHGATGPLRLTEAQFLIARAHAFASWRDFRHHVEALERGTSAAASFEAAADAVVAGDMAGLARLLGDHPRLIEARSRREHHATLLHYVSANGVEDFRQHTPPNIVDVARLLLEAGSDVDAEAHAYGGRWTTLALVASSTPPRRAGVQDDLLQLLLDHGADIDHRGDGADTPITGAIRNGQGEAARFLAARGARLPLGSAAAVGDLDAVGSHFHPDGTPPPGASMREAETGLVYAALYGHTEVVRYLLDRGTRVSAQDGHGQSALHHAALGGHLAIVRLLLERGAPIELTNAWGGTPLGQAVWCVAHEKPGPDYIRIIEALLDAGARVENLDYPTGEEGIDALLSSRGAIEARPG